MTEDRSLDIVGIGKLAEAVPDIAWEQIVKTACSTFEKVILPLTATTSGVGRLIEAKFNRLLEAEKIIISQTFEQASLKAQGAKHKSGKNLAKTSIILKVIENSSCEVNPTLQELWSNLLANELVDGSIHPEFPRILSRMSSSDAHRLIEIAQNIKKSTFMTALLKSLEETLELRPDLDFTNAQLLNLGLIRTDGRDWTLRIVGYTFVVALTDPSFEETELDSGSEEAKNS